MKNTKWILGIATMMIFLISSVSAQDGAPAKKKTETTTVKSPKGDTKVDRADRDDVQETDDADLNKYKKRKKVKKSKKAKKAKKAYKGKGNAYGRDKETSGKEFGKKRSDDAKNNQEGMSDDAGPKINNASTAPTKGGTPDVAPTAPVKNTKEQIATMESKLARMKNMVETKDLSDDAKRKYAERIAETEKELASLRTKQETVTE